jgi:predicted MFS family arabinose efflux permease
VIRPRVTAGGELSGVVPGWRVILLLGVLVGVLVALLIWGITRSARRRDRLPGRAGESELLVGLLVLAALALGAFLAYTLVST